VSKLRETVLSLRTSGLRHAGVRCDGCIADPRKIGVARRILPQASSFCVKSPRREAPLDGKDVVSGELDLTDCGQLTGLRQGGECGV